MLTCRRIASVHTMDIYTHLHTYYLVHTQSDLLFTLPRLNVNRLIGSCYKPSDQQYNNIITNNKSKVWLPLRMVTLRYKIFHIVAICNES